MPITASSSLVLGVPENRAALIVLGDVAVALAGGEANDTTTLFLHGPAGSGKTHLTRAMQRGIEQSCDATVIRLAASEFAAADNLRNADLLIVEDLQHLPSASCESFVQMLDDRAARQRWTVITACNGPGNLCRRGVPLPVRLRSRLASGMCVALEPLAKASRLQVLEQLAERSKVTVTPEILAWLAENMSTWRQLAGAMTRLAATLPQTVAEVAALFENLVAKPNVEQVAARVSAYYGLSPRRIRSAGRAHNLLLPRQVGMYLARRLANVSLHAIGRYFGGRDHSTVLHACAKIESALKNDVELDIAVRNLESELCGN